MNELETALKSVQHWKRVAAYLASCHAATLECLPKRASKSERKRLAQVCRRSAAYLIGTESPRQYETQSVEELILSEIRRCENAAKNHDVEDNKP